MEKYNHNQLHMAISLYLSARFNSENEQLLWRPLRKFINKGKVPPDKGRILFIKNIQIGSIIIFSYAIENLMKAFLPQIKRRHISVVDFSTKLRFNELESLILLKTILPLLKDGLLRYPEPEQEQYFLDTSACKAVFIKIFRFYIKKLKLNLSEVKCFKLEFLRYQYPYIKELISD